MCAHESSLIRMVAGELTAQARDDCFSHIESCLSCREKYAQLRSTWDALAAWETLPPGKDLTEAVLAAARRPERSRWWISAGAAILVASGVGIAAGLLVPVGSGTMARQNVPTEEVVQAVGLDAFADSTLFAPLFDPQSGNPEEDQP